jgi:hypothetical protein
MGRLCEVCAALPEAPAAGGRLRRLLIEDRVVMLCQEHGERVSSRPLSLEQLCSLFPELSGRRSLLSRRAPLDRRVFPARPEGRRRSNGRRAADHA